MKKTTLCYIMNNNSVLMLYRNKKENDYNEGKWIGIGGKLESDETPEECLVREVMEETKIMLNSWHFYGIIHFRSDCWGNEDMYLYSSDDYHAPNELPECNEGELRWVEKENILDLPTWEGDKYFLKPMIEGIKNIEITLEYQGDELINVF